MTEDFKLNLLKYFTNNFNQDIKENEPQWQATQEVETNLNTFLIENIGAETFVIDNNILEPIVENSQNNNFIAIYGIKNVFSVPYESFIVICDIYFRPIQYIDTYSDGTSFGEITRVSVANDGSFNLVEKNNGISTFKILNNIVAKLPTSELFTVEARKSYQMPADVQDNGTKYFVYDIVKNPTAEEYGFLITSSNVESTPVRSIIVYNFRLSLRGEVEWIKYNTSEQNATLGSNPKIYVDFTENFNFSVLFTENVNNIINLILLQNNNSETITRTQLLNGADNFDNKYNSVIIDNKTMYFVEVRRNNIIDSLQVLGWSYVNNILDTTYIGATRKYDSFVNADIITKDNEVYITFNDLINDTQYDLVVGVIFNGQFKTHVVKTVEKESYNVVETLLIVNKKYNLNNYIINVGDNTYNSQQVFNSNNYNGLPSYDYDSLKPNQGVLYDNDTIVFARNLYNKLIQNNTTTSIIQIPNTAIPDTNITTEELVSTKNNIINSNSIPITTNIYEEILINFINTLSIVNLNIPNEEIFNLNGSSRLNYSISELADYNDAKLGYFRINYSDGTIEDKILETTSFDETNINANYDILVIVAKEINNIQFLSNDKNTIYHTIENLNTLEIGKTYSINQYVEVM